MIPFSSYSFFYAGERLHHHDIRTDIPCTTSSCVRLQSLLPDYCRVKRSVRLPYLALSYISIVILCIDGTVFEGDLDGVVDSCTRTIGDIRFL